MRGRTNAGGGGGVEFAAVSFDGTFSINGRYIYYVSENGLVCEELINFSGPINVQKGSLLFFSDRSFANATGDITLVAGGAATSQGYSLYFVEGDGQIEVAI